MHAGNALAPVLVLAMDLGDMALGLVAVARGMGMVVPMMGMAMVGVIMAMIMGVIVGMGVIMVMPLDARIAATADGAHHSTSISLIRISSPPVTVIW